MGYRDTDRAIDVQRDALRKTRDAVVNAKLDLILDALHRKPDPIPIPEPVPEPEPDPDTYVFDTDRVFPSGWSHMPQHGADFGELLLNAHDKVPQRPVKAYSLSLWLTGRPTYSRAVLAWCVGGEGKTSDNRNKFSDLVWLSKKGGKIKWHQGFGVSQEEQTTDEALAPWNEGGKFSVEHHVFLAENMRDNLVASPVGNSGRLGTPPIGNITIPAKGVFIALGDADGASPVGATYTRVRFELVFA